LRFAALDRIPWSLWIDDVSLIEPAMSLAKSPADFADSIRVHPFGVPKPFGAVGVLYLELFRLSLDRFGTTVFGVRFFFALAGTLSLATGALLGRVLLPRGGGTLVALTLSGLRWNLILSRWSYAIVIVPVVDLAMILMIRARRRGRSWEAAAAGALVGLAAHVYLSSWIVACALLLFAIWPQEGGTPRTVFARRGLLFLACFVLAVSPLFLFRQGRRGSYFARSADHNVRLEISRTRSIMPPFAAAADALAAPWFLSDPIARHELPGATRLGLLAIPLALVLTRSMLTAREDLSALILANGVAAIAANVAGGQADLPNGMRFIYLMSLAVVAAAGGILWLLTLCPHSYRRALAIASLGGLAIFGALQTRQALWIWAEGRAAFDGFGGEDTLLGQTVNRWERYGPVQLDSALGHYALTIRGVRRYKLNPLEDRRYWPAPSSLREDRSFRVVDARQALAPGERVVEWVQDAWGRRWGKVIGERSEPVRSALGVGGVASG